MASKKAQELALKIVAYFEENFDNLRDTPITPEAAFDLENMIAAIYEKPAVRGLGTRAKVERKKMRKKKEVGHAEPK